MHSRSRSRTGPDPYPAALDPTSPSPWEPTTDGRTVLDARTAELRFPVIDPTRIVSGHGSYIPWRPWAVDPATPEGFHATVFPRWWAQVTEGERPHPSDWPCESCPACGGQIARPDRVLTVIGLARLGAVVLPIYRVHRTTWADRRTHCLVCNGRDPASEANLRAQRRAAERDRAERTIAATVRDADRRHVGALEDDRAGRVLTELERRRIWLGYRGDPRTTPDAIDRDGTGRSFVPTERALAGRAWLRSIGQEPDWSLILDRRGRVVGRYVYDPDTETWTTESVSNRETDDVTATSTQWVEAS